MKCEYCGGEYKNVKVHQRFCKAKKEALEKGKEISEEVKEETISTPEELEKIAEEAKVEQEAVSEAITPTVPEEPTPEGKIEGELVDPDEEKITQEHVDLVNKALEGTDALELKEPEEEKDLVLEGEMKKAMEDLGTVTLKGDALKEEQERKEKELEKQVKDIPGAIFKKELAVEFHEPKDVWQEKLHDIFKQVPSGEIIHIKLKERLCHEFLNLGGTYRYPSDVFVNIIRDHCDGWKDEVNNQGGQTFICKKK